MMALTVRNASAILFIVSFAFHLIAVFMRNGRGKFKWFVETPNYVKLERGLLIPAFLIAALGVALLEIALREAGAMILRASALRLS